MMLPFYLALLLSLHQAYAFLPCDKSNKIHSVYTYSHYANHHGSRCFRQTHASSLFGFRANVKEKIKGFVVEREKKQHDIIVETDKQHLRSGTGNATMDNLSVLLDLPNASAPFLHICCSNNNNNHQTRRPQKKTEREFRDKIAYFERYSERDIALLASYRLRIVMEGMAASLGEPDVYRAFEILYTDLPPLRLAGRMIFKRLQHVMNMVVQERQREVEHLLLETNGNQISKSDLEAAQYAFLVLKEATETTYVDERGINNDREHDITITISQLMDSGLITALANWLEIPQKEDEVMLLLDPTCVQMLDFPSFMLGLQRCTQKTAQKNIDYNAIQLLEFLLQELDRSPGSLKRRNQRLLDPQRQAYSNRYDNMLNVFLSRKQQVPSGQGRRLDVLQGCFIGAKNVAVRDALRIVYVDVAAMRVAGNTIFALVSALLPTKESTGSRVDNQ